jgi:hypothetical protein
MIKLNNRMKNQIELFTMRLINREQNGNETPGKTTTLAPERIESTVTSPQTNETQKREDIETECPAPTLARL